MPADARLDALADYLRTLLDGMGLHLWHLRVRWATPEDQHEEHDPYEPDGETLLRVRYLYGYLSVTLCVTEGFFAESPPRQRHHLVHECVHLIQSERNRLIASLETCGALGSREYSLFRAEYDYADERVTDAMAALIAPRFPLPAWPEEDPV